MSPSTYDNEKVLVQTENVEQEGAQGEICEGDSLVRAAAAGAEQERAMGVIESIKLYPKAIFFSMAMSLCLVQEGYDTAILGSFFAQPAFRNRFGTLAPDGTMQITPKWASGLLNGTAVGEILGLQLAGFVAERIGYRKTLMAGLVMLTGSIFISFFAQNLGMLFAGDILCGIPWGAFQTITITYAAEVCPIHLRHVLTSFVNMCWSTGQLLASGILRGLIDNETQWGWRIPYAIQWVWPLPILIVVFFAPESPYWLVRKGRLDDARKSLMSLTSRRNTSFNPDDSVALIIQTNEEERLLREGVSYRDCFRGVDLRRTEITCLSWVCQVTCGVWFGASITYFLEQTGFSADRAFDFGVGISALGWVSTVFAWWIMTRVGRRRLYLVGMGSMFIILVAVGFMGIPEPSPAISYATAAFLCLFIVAFDLTIGPCVYTLVAEMPSTRLKIKTVVIGRNVYNIVSICANFLNPPILNPLGWNLRGKGGFVWCGFCFLSLVWGIFRLPETKGLTYEEIDILFEKKVNARKFSRALAQEYLTRAHSSSFVAETNVIDTA